MAARILDAAAEEFERAGYSGATTAAIARRADVTEAQIFRLYASKQELFRASVFAPLNAHFVSFQQAHAAEMAEAETDRDLARQYIHELQDFIEKHSRMFLSLLVASAYSPDLADGVGDLESLRSYFDRGAQTMASRMGREGAVAPELMVRVSFAAVLANLMFREWLFPPGLASQEAIREAITDFVIDGIRASEG